MKTKRRGAAREIAVVALSVALVAACAWISVPFGAVPVTLQTFAVALVGALLGLRRSVAAVGVYLLAGLIGIPVFAGFQAGAAALFGVTGGYLFGFLFEAALPALAKGVPTKSARARTAVFYGTMILGLCFCYLFGTIWFAALYRCSVGYALAVCVLPFLLPDAVKLLFAALLAVRLEKYLR